MVTGLIYKGMNDFCGRDIKIYNDCMAHFTALHDADDPPPEYKVRPIMHSYTDDEAPARTAKARLLA